MRGNFFAAARSGAVLVLGSVTASRAQQPSAAADQGNPSQASGKGQRERGFGGFMGGGRGILGSVTEAASDHYTVKTETGDLYTVHFSVNTRILKQPPGGRNFSPDGSGRNSGARRSSADADSSDLERQVPLPIKPTDIKVGDIITAGGEIDASAKSVGAVMIMQIDPERAKQMRQMQANFGKTWLAGRITAIDGTRITIEGALDRTPHAIDVDENTSFRQRRDAITLADIKPGEQLHAEGAVKDGVFRATLVNAMMQQNRDNNPGAATASPQP
jgi:hypothetical protein